MVFVGFRLFGVWLGLYFLAEPLVDDCGVCFGLLDGLPDGGVCGLGPDVWLLFGSMLGGFTVGYAVLTIINRVVNTRKIEK